jgi:histidinol-phosphate/aromatic aminotransferase/cobyric acid decarboxylase-like protein
MGLSIAEAAQLASLTSDERDAQRLRRNLADAHARQTMGAGERETILERFVEFFDLAAMADYRDLEIDSGLAFLRSLGQQPPPDRFVATYASSISTMIVGYLLRERDAVVSLTCPTFDNLHALLTSTGTTVIPRHLGESPIEALVHGVDCLFEVSPNNPTGHYVDAHDLAELANACRDVGTLLILDQSFKGHDERCCYDHYAILESSGVSYIVIEDTGKLWPTGDLKVSYVVASADLFADLRTHADNVLMNVAPFLLCLVRAYAAYSEPLAYRNVRDVIGVNRRLVRETLSQGASTLEVVYPQSRVGVEMIGVELSRWGRLTDELRARSVATLEGGKFYWDGSEPTLPQLRISLSRDPSDFTDSFHELVAAARHIG